MKENLIKKKTFSFALMAMEVSRSLVKEEKEFVLSKQLMRSGTAIGALVRESEQAESKKDFIHKLAIALKEANEKEYWIDLIIAGKYLNEKNFNDIQIEIKEIIKILRVFDLRLKLI